MESKEIELIKDVRDAIDKIKKLQKQIDHPTREGMKKALSDAKASALVEIIATEISQGDTNFMLWDQFSDADLYRKLPQYQQGLRNFCISKVGQHTFEQMMNTKTGG